jgi:hypothetical protein
VQYVAMPSVFMMRHHDVPCAVPAAQVITVLTDRGATEQLELWPDTHSLSPERYLHVRTSLGDRTLSCVEPWLTQLASAEVFALPALVQRELNHPCVVGIARGPARWVWLIDLDRL